VSAFTVLKSLAAVACAGFALMAHAQGELPDCLARARADAVKGYEQHRSAAEAREQLEVAAARCADPAARDDVIRLRGRLNTDRARIAHAFVTGAQSLAWYRATRADRLRKQRTLQAASSALAAWAEGDADGDLVPDRSDRCPRTPALQPTDDIGCPIEVRATPRDERDERQLRDVLRDSRVLFNASCADAPPLRIPQPLQWGRGAQVRLGTHGFNFAITKVPGQPAGCDVFYEVQFRFIDPNPGNPALPPAKFVTVVFGAGEDLIDEPARVIFGVPMLVQLTPARDKVREAVNREYFRASWRVRAVNGANATSPWSPFVTQGPATGGVHGG
jgi:hypothetical protein